jgi:hypothetical protein
MLVRRSRHRCAVSLAGPVTVTLPSYSKPTREGAPRGAPRRSFRPGTSGCIDIAVCSLRVRVATPPNPLSAPVRRRKRPDAGQQATVDAQRDTPVMDACPLVKVVRALSPCHAATPQGAREPPHDSTPTHDTMLHQGRGYPRRTIDCVPPPARTAPSACRYRRRTARTRVRRYIGRYEANLGNMNHFRRYTTGNRHLRELFWSIRAFIELSDVL